MSKADIDLTSSSPVADLIDQALSGVLGPNPTHLAVAGAFWIEQATRFPGTTQKYKNHYLLVRVEGAFGGCCVERNTFPSDIAGQLAGLSLAQLLTDERMAVRIAGLDAYFAHCSPHERATNATRLLLPQGPPLPRAVARDQAISGLIRISEGAKVGLIGVVNPLVEAIEAQGGVCLPCDYNMTKTAKGLTVAHDMEPVLAEADHVIATGMTLGNGSFERLLIGVRRRNIPLVVYAQTGSAIVPQFLGKGVAAVSAEPFPFSQFSADATPIYLYRAAVENAD